MNQNNKSPHRVLIVDDNVAIRTVLKDLLELEGHIPLMASNGKEALELLKDEKNLPHIILLDMRMPIMDGREFRHLQMQHQLHPEIPLFIFCAGSKYESYLVEMEATGILNKPIDMDELLDTINPYLGREDFSGASK